MISFRGKLVRQTWEVVEPIGDPEISVTTLDTGLLRASLPEDVEETTYSVDISHLARPILGSNGASK